MDGIVESFEDVMIDVVLAASGASTVELFQAGVEKYQREFLEAATTFAKSMWNISLSAFCEFDLEDTRSAESAH